MKRLTMIGVVMVAALGLVLASPWVFAEDQSRTSGQSGGQAGVRTGGGPPGGSAAGGGQAVARGSGGAVSGGSSGGGGQAVPRGGGSVSSGGSSGSGGGGTSVGTAVPRGSSGGYADSPRYRGSGAIRSSGDGSGGGLGQAVPRESRPRGDRPAMGTAIPRSEAPAVRPSSGWNAYYPSYLYGNYYGYPYYGSYGSYWNWYYGFGYYPSWNWGLGAFYWDPFWGGLYSPWYRYGSVYGYDPYYGDPYGRAYAVGQYRLVGELKLKVQPKHAEVYVDGYYMGTVDDFDGVFQSLRLQAETYPGMPHRIEIRAQGFEPVTFEVRITPGESITYRGELQPLQPPDIK